MTKVLIIAEAGVNHNGNFDLAIKLIDAAKTAGADAIKFQTWKTELLVTSEAELADYQATDNNKHSSQFEMLKELELSYEEFSKLKTYCDEIGILFLSTPDEFTSAKFLNELQNTFKIGSGELTNIPFLIYIANFKKNVLLSTGMSSLGEVEEAVNALIEGGLLRSQITLLHATTEYPAPHSELNLSAMLTLKQAFQTKVGYSDHSIGIEASIAAVALGATVIEKHFTLDKNMSGPDHQASIEPNELESMVKSIRNIEVALGHGRKEPSVSEIKNKNITRKSIVAAQSIEQGEIFSIENLTLKRPANGLAPDFWNELIGKKANKPYKKDENITFG